MYGKGKGWHSLWISFEKFIFSSFFIDKYANLTVVSQLRNQENPLETQDLVWYSLCPFSFTNFKFNRIGSLFSVHCVSIQRLNPVSSITINDECTIPSIQIERQWRKLILAYFIKRFSARLLYFHLLFSKRYQLHDAVNCFTTFTVWFGHWIEMEFQHTNTNTHRQRGVRAINWNWSFSVHKFLSASRDKCEQRIIL